MIEMLIRLIYNPETKLFEFTLGEKKWNLTAKEAERLVKDARKQLIDATDAMIEFNLSVSDWTINLHGVKSKPAFEYIVKYLDKVWYSYERYNEIHPQ